MTNIAWREDALFEAQEALVFYKALGKSEAFARDLELTLQNIALRERMDQRVSQTKRYNLKKFPYYIGYGVAKDKRIWILTVSYQGRKDQTSWRKLNL